MNKFCFAAGLMAAAWLAGCGGQTGAPPAPTIHIAGLPPAANPDAPVVTALNGQVWASTSPGGPQRRVVVRDDLGFLGWWVQQPDTGPPIYGVFEGSLSAMEGTNRFGTLETVSLQLPDYDLSITQLGMTAPEAGESRMGFDVDMASTATSELEPMRADALAHQPLPMEQRSGRFAGELQLSDRREPVSLQWNGDGSLNLSMTQLPGADCGAFGQTTPLTGAPVRVLAFTLTFSGAGCPTLQLSSPASVGLAGLSVSGAIDASSADAFVMFGQDSVTRMPLVLPATRIF
jgi:hypothetical protein